MYSPYSIDTNAIASANIAVNTITDTPIVSNSSKNLINPLYFPNTITSP